MSCTILSPLSFENRLREMSYESINVDDLLEEINRMPKTPSLKRNTDGSYHKLDKDKQYDVSDFKC